MDMHVYNENLGQTNVMFYEFLLIQEPHQEILSSSSLERNKVLYFSHETTNN